ncbi:alpha/beta fold hydrolase [Erythrobacter sp. NE805]|uniref:alpha/beta fold hydrolase n=1 Tax=Erythrobacter sp. NE805 TaxID=3389875 RepID=UPI00396B047F
MTPFLVGPVFPYLAAGAVLLLGLFLLWRGKRGRGWGRRLGFGFGAVLALFGLALAAGAIAMSNAARALEAARPAGGRFVAVGGERLFVKCEGPRGGPTLLLISGAYSSGWFLAPLHEALRASHRSCLVDRPGTGWADPAQSPRTVEAIIAELMGAVTAAGETGQIIPVGHSVGGLFAANLAQAYPDRVSAAVLLDPTPPSWFVEQQALYGCGPSSPGGLAFWASMFGLGLVPSLNPMNADTPGSPNKALGAIYPTLVNLESRPRSLAAQREALANACRSGLSLVRSPGALGDLPVLMIVQDQPAAEIAKQMPKDLTPREQTNWKLLRAQWERDYVGFTTRGTLVKAPAGSGHYFVLNEPAFTLGEIRKFLAATARPAAPPVNP